MWEAADSQDFLGLIRSEAAMAEHFYRSSIDGEFFVL